MNRHPPSGHVRPESRRCKEHGPGLRGRGAAPAAGLRAPACSAGARRSAPPGHRDRDFDRAPELRIRRAQAQVEQRVRHLRNADRDRVRATATGMSEQRRPCPPVRGVLERGGSLPSPGHDRPLSAAPPFVGPRSREHEAMKTRQEGATPPLARVRRLAHEHVGEAVVIESPAPAIAVPNRAPTPGPGSRASGAVSSCGPPAYR